MASGACAGAAASPPGKQARSLSGRQRHCAHSARRAGGRIERGGVRRDQRAGGSGRSGGRADQVARTRGRRTADPHRTRPQPTLVGDSEPAGELPPEVNDPRQPRHRASPQPEIPFVGERRARPPGDSQRGHVSESAHRRGGLPGQAAELRIGVRMGDQVVATGPGDPGAWVPGTAVLSRADELPAPAGAQHDRHRRARGPSRRAAGGRLQDAEQQHEHGRAQSRGEDPRDQCRPEQHSAAELRSSIERSRADRRPIQSVLSSFETNLLHFLSARSPGPGR